MGVQRTLRAPRNGMKVDWSRLKSSEDSPQLKGLSVDNFNTDLMVLLMQSL